MADAFPRAGAWDAPPPRRRLAFLNVSWFVGESSSGVSRDDYISQVARDIQNKMPKVFDLDQVRKHLGLSITPTMVVLLQELGRFNKLVTRMSRSLVELQRVSAAPRAQLGACGSCGWA